MCLLMDGFVTQALQHNASTFYSGGWLLLARSPAGLPQDWRMCNEMKLSLLLSEVLPCAVFWKEKAELVSVLV